MSILNLYELFQSQPEYFNFHCGRKDNARTLCDNTRCLLCYERSLASYPKSVYWDPNNETSPRFVFKGEGKKEYSFLCNCGHKINKTPKSVLSSRWCQYCASHNSKVCDDLTCAYCFSRSFASSLSAPFWHPDNEKTARQVTISSKERVNFICPIGHIFEAYVFEMNRKFNCPCCTGNTLCKNLNCEQCASKSFQSHPMSKHWCASNPKTPRELFLNSTEMGDVLCPYCNHHFPSCPMYINIGRWCPFCTKYNGKVCKDLTCNHCFNRSFASDPNAIYWAPNNKKTAREVLRWSSEKHDFICEAGHTSNIFVFSVTQGYWCGKCKHKTQRKLLEHLIPIYSDVEGQKTFDWCKNINHLPFDFYIPQLNLIIELDGPQHFRQIQNWDTPERIQERDVYKMNACLQHGISMVRILQRDVWRDRINWKVRLAEKLQQYPIPQIITISEGNEYDVYSGRIQIPTSFPATPMLPDNPMLQDTPIKSQPTIRLSSTTTKPQPTNKLPIIPKIPQPTNRLPIIPKIPPTSIKPQPITKPSSFPTKPQLIVKLPYIPILASASATQQSTIKSTSQQK